MIEDGHLGGFVQGGDPDAWEPQLWDALIKDFQIKSVLDVGCGEGYSTKYFLDKGCSVLGIDGSEKVLENSPLPKLYIMIFDYTKGAVGFDKAVWDLVWCCEFVEHVEAKFIPNFLESFKAGKIIAMTHALPNQGGHHHVNEQNDDYWIKKIEKIGFKYDDKVTQKYRAIAQGKYFKQSGLIFMKKV